MLSSQNAEDMIEFASLCVNYWTLKFSIELLTDPALNTKTRLFKLDKVTISNIVSNIDKYPGECNAALFALRKSQNEVSEEMFKLAIKFTNEMEIILPNLQEKIERGINRKISSSMFNSLMEYDSKSRIDVSLAREILNFTGSISNSIANGILDEMAS